jgi:hypothetical protein
MHARDIISVILLLIALSGVYSLQAWGAWLSAHGLYGLGWAGLFLVTLAILGIHWYVQGGFGPAPGLALVCRRLLTVVLQLVIIQFWFMVGYVVTVGVHQQLVRVLPAGLAYAYLVLAVAGYGFGALALLGALRRRGVLG